MKLVKKQSRLSPVLIKCKVCDDSLIQHDGEYINIFCRDDCDLDSCKKILAEKDLTEPRVYKD